MQVDDTLAVFHTHTVAGLLGGILTGFLAEPELCRMVLPMTGVRGIFYGGGVMQLVKQLVGAVFVILWNLVITTAILFLIKYFVQSWRTFRLLLKHRPRVVFVMAPPVIAQRSSALTHAVAPDPDASEELEPPEVDMAPDLETDDDTNAPAVTDPLLETSQTSCRIRSEPGLRGQASPSR